MPRGSLAIVGTGIRAGLETTPEAQACLRLADKVFYLVADSLAAAWLERLNPAAESLAGLYRPGLPRLATYEAMVEKILAPARGGMRVCAAFYGHPGVFVYPGHEALERARREGIDARMLPGVCAADRLFCDLGVDPGALGLQSYEATSFLVHGYRFDPRAALVLWQIGALGDLNWTPDAGPSHLEVLAGHLARRYGAAHEVTVYEAARDPLSEPAVHRAPLAELPAAPVTPGSTLYVPPKGALRPDRAMLRRLGIRAKEWGA